MKQQSLATVGFEPATKRTRKREFLDEMNLVVPWAELVGLIQSHAPAGKTGLPPFAVVTMLRIYFMQQWLDLSDPVMDEALQDVPLYGQFAQMNLGMSRLPDKSTILRFRHMLEAHGLSLQIMVAINATLAKKGLMLKTSTVVDATLIAAPSSTKNKDVECDSKMHQSKKGTQWHFMMKAHIGVDAVGPGAQRHRDGRQRERRHPRPWAAARQGVCGVCLRELPGRRQAPGGYQRSSGKWPCARASAARKDTA